MYDLLLYYFDTCKYCQKVLAFMNQESIQIPVKDIVGDANNMKELLERTGRYRVPCLFINGEPLYESEDIINWLKKSLIRK